MIEPQSYECLVLTLPTQHIEHTIVPLVTQTKYPVQLILEFQPARCLWAKVENANEE